RLLRRHGQVHKPAARHVDDRRGPVGPTGRVLPAERQAGPPQPVLLHGAPVRRGRRGRKAAPAAFPVPGSRPALRPGRGPARAAPTVYTGPDGQPIRFVPGRTWIELTQAGATAIVR